MVRQRKGPRGLGVEQEALIARHIGEPAQQPTTIDADTRAVRHDRTHIERDARGRHILEQPDVAPDER